MPRKDGTGPMGQGARTGQRGSLSNEKFFGRGQGLGNRNGQGNRGRNGICTVSTDDVHVLKGRIEQIEVELEVIKAKLDKL